jgi:hypothetical protein
MATFAYLNKKCRPDGALGLLILLWLPNCRHYVAKANAKKISIPLIFSQWKCIKI